MASPRRLGRSKTRGVGWAQHGLAVIARLADQNPATQAFLVTAFATTDAVRQAFHDGATDYLEKTPILEAILLRKVDLAGKAAERAMGTPNQAQRELRSAWQEAKTSTHSQRKGSALERTIKLLFESIPGFRHARTNVKNDMEEIDVLVMNRSTEPLLTRQGDFFVVE